MTKLDTVNHSQFELEALEPRIMLSGNPAVAADSTPAVNVNCEQQIDGAALNDLSFQPSQDLDFDAFSGEDTDPTDNGNNTVNESADTCATEILNQDVFVASGDTFSGNSIIDGDFISLGNVNPYKECHI